MNRLMVASFAAIGLLAAACGAGSSGTSVPQRLAANDVALVRPSPNVDYTSLAAGTRALGYALGGKLAANATNGNVVYSPASLAIGFAMLREGAAGQTAASIDRVFHLPADRHASYNGLVTALQTPGSGNILETNNGLFFDPTLTIKRSYLVSLKKWYGASVYQTDFPDPALDDINSYVDTNTHGRIPRLLDHLDANEIFALINTVYLNAKWQQPFAGDETRDESFTLRGGSHAMVSMMHQMSPLDYASGPGWQAVRLQYRGDRLSMWVMLPTGQQAPLELLAPPVLDAAGAGFGTRNVDLSLPRWDFGNLCNLKDPLTALGLTDTFNGQTDFSGITSGGSFVISRVLQQANITVSEKGTVAAAATAIIGADSAPLLPPDRVVFDATHPFAFAIMDNRTGTPLFEGTVSNPT